MMSQNSITESGSKPLGNKSKLAGKTSLHLEEEILRFLVLYPFSTFNLKKQNWNLATFP